MAKRTRAAEKQPPAENEPADAAATEAEPGGGAKPRPAWRAGADFIVMLGGAVLAALVIKAYVFDVYLIPSGSMETALHGRPDGGDRIFCPKITYRFRGLRRWEVAVFEFPYESARRSDYYNISEQYKGQNFVKRVVGLPGESLSIRRGDIWTRPDGAREEYRRMVKPDSVQRGMWLKVYEQDFRDISLREMETFWRLEGGDASMGRGGPLRLSAAGESVRMTYRPMVPAGIDKDLMTELPGVPDRYTLDQPVQFRCAAADAGDEPCGHVFVQSFRSQNMQARCPRCGSLQNETSAIFYHRRSGLPGVGRYVVNPRSAPQGEDVPPRQSDYHIVPDLRLRLEARLESSDTALVLTLREDSRKVQARLWGDGRAEIAVNDQPSRVEWRSPSALRPGRDHRVEFYVVEGTARLFVDGADSPLIEAAVWDDKRPQTRSLPKSSGVEIEVNAGALTFSSLDIDRDIFYYSGRERDGGESFAQMNVNGDVVIDGSSFLPMGDHCPSSFDARSWGPVPLSLLRGPAALIWWPPDRISRIAAP